MKLDGKRLSEQLQASAEIDDSNCIAGRDLRAPTSTDVTLPSSSRCDHKDMAGDSLVDVRGPYHRCTSCGASWTDKELVIVNDETAA